MREGESAHDYNMRMQATAETIADVFIAAGATGSEMALICARIAGYAIGISPPEEQRAIEQMVMRTLDEGNRAANKAREKMGKIHAQQK